MSLRSSVAGASASIARFGLQRVLHRRGGSIPGMIALKLDPDILRELAPLFQSSVVVTGTNGKTTTTNLLADALAANGTCVVTNRAGNNMEAGIAGAILEDRARAKGARDATGPQAVGCFECDELYTARVLPKLKPNYLVLLNLFRDQLDRYGEIDHTQDVIAGALASSPATTLVYNADDPLCASIARRVENPTIAFGFAASAAGAEEPDKVSDSRFCAVCNAPLEYDYVLYGQLGSYRCPSCGWARPALDIVCDRVEMTPEGQDFGFHFAKSAQAEAPARDRRDLSLGYHGLYMVYNAMAALGTASLMGADRSRFQQVLDAYHPARGRMEKRLVKGRRLLVNLAKNPVGFDRIIQIVQSTGAKTCAFYINDKDADGHDISWIYDVDFERLASMRGLTVFAGGTRAEDLQVRLKYAGVPSTVVRGAEDAIDQAAARGIDAGETIYIVGNYTATLELTDELDRLPEGDEPPAADRASTGDRADAGASDAADTAPEAADAAPVADAEAPTLPTAAEVAWQSWSTVAPGAVAPTYAALAENPLTICHLYPAELNLYGDTGNVAILAARCAWRGIPVRVTTLNRGEEADLTQVDIAVIGGGADRDQLAVQHELMRHRDAVDRFLNHDQGVMLAICGGYQLLGRHYYLGDEKIEGLGVIGIETRRAEVATDRLIGNVAVTSDIVDAPIMGFENHGGRTFLDADEKPLGTSVVPGTGNNGEDGFEGIVHGGLVGTYFHGPVLSKNPALADWLIAHALRRRGIEDALVPLADAEEAGARRAFEKKLPHHS